MNTLKLIVLTLALTSSNSVIANATPSGPNSFGAVVCHELRNEQSGIRADGTVSPVCSLEFDAVKSATNLWITDSSAANAAAVKQAEASASVCADAFEKSCSSTLNR
jgi:hypothetical protein